MLWCVWRCIRCPKYYSIYLKWGWTKHRAEATAAPAILSIQRISLICRLQAPALFPVSRPPRCTNTLLCESFEGHPHWPLSSLPSALLICGSQCTRHHSTAHGRRSRQSKNAPPSTLQLRLTVHWPIHCKCYLAKCTKWLETLFPGNFINSSAFLPRCVAVWIRPSRGSPTEDAFSAHDLTPR